MQGDGAKGGTGQLFLSGTGHTGFKGVYLTAGRYQAACTTAPCRRNHLGTFGIPNTAFRSAGCTSTRLG